MTDAALRAKCEAWMEKHEIETASNGKPYSFQVTALLRFVRSIQAEVRREAADVCRDFDRQTWNDIEEKYLVTLDALHPDLGRNIALVLEAKAKALEGV